MSHRTILVTGSTSGIGREITMARLKAGDTVIGFGRKHDKFDPGHGAYIPYTVDVADETALTGTLKKVLSQHPKLDAVVSNAGFGTFGPLENYSSSQIKTFLNVNLLSHILVARQCMPHFKAIGGGQLVFMGSEAALQGAQKGSLYCTAKFGLRGLAQSLRAEGASRGVRVTIINPGMVRTPFFDDLKFRPGPESTHSLSPTQVARAIDTVLDADPGAVFDEINLSPLKSVIAFD